MCRRKVVKIERIKPRGHDRTIWMRESHMALNGLHTRGGARVVIDGVLKVAVVRLYARLRRRTNRKENASSFFKVP